MDKFFKIIEQQSGETIRKLRIHRQITQQELGAGFMLQSSIGKIEKGKNQPLFLNVLKMIDKLNINTHEFLFITNNYEADDKSNIFVLSSAS